MRVLLDTSAFLWAASEPEKLSVKAQDTIRDAQNQLFFSLASVWEIQIKVQLRKLNLKNPLLSTIETQQQKNGIQLLEIELPHILALADIADHHRDPFDRLLVAQARAESLTFITNDAKIQQYDVTWLW